MRVAAQASVGSGARQPLGLAGLAFPTPMSPRIEAEATRICRLRLAHQFLTTPGPRTGAAVVAALGAVQAQDFSGAKWAIAQRARVDTDADVEREYAEGRVLRTHVLRPTWHFVAPRDLRWMLALTGPRVSARMAPYNRTLDLGPAEFRRCNDAIARALEGGHHLTRAELARALEGARVGAVSGPRLGHVMMQAELDAVVCSGPRRGKDFTYALLDERVPAMPPLDGDEALLELTRRYFTTHGPATPQDFAWWSGLAVAEARRGIEIAGRALERVIIGSRNYWMSARAGATPRAACVHLLPNYDEYFIAFKDRSAIAQRLGDARLVVGGYASLPHVIIADGQLVGGWTRTIVKDTVRVHLRLRTRVSAGERRRIVAAAEAYGAFLGMPAVLSFA